MESNKAICLFGHLRTFKYTAKVLNEYADKINADIFIYTWDTTDNSDSYHGLNMKSSPTNSIEGEIINIYPRLRKMKIGSQNNEINSLKFISESGDEGIIGHQYHMWASVKCVLQLCQEYSFENNLTYDNVICTRPDIKLKTFFERFSVLGPGFNFGCQKKYTKPYQLAEVDLYDLFFIINSNFYLVVDRLMKHILETKGKILSQNNYLLNFLNQEKMPLHPLNYIYGEDFEIIRSIKPLRRLLLSFRKIKILSNWVESFNILLSNTRIRYYSLLRKYRFLTSLNYKLEGYKFKLSIDSLYSFEYFKFHDKTIKKELSAFKKISEKHDRFLDVGALHGIFSFVFTNGNHKKSIAVDPSPIAYPILEKNIKLNLNDIESEQIALSNSNSRIRMKFNWQHLEATLIEGDEDVFIESVKMDEFISNKSFYPDLIKIDVEGYEFFVLNGGSVYLSEHKPTIFLELHHEMLRNLTHSTKDVIAFLTNLNYKIYDLDMNLFNTEFDYYDGVERVICICKS